jgi:hypothetical protein
VTRAQSLQLALFAEHQAIWCTTRPRRKPVDRFSVEYCLWLVQSHKQRFEALRNEGFKCWECGVVLMPRWMHLHHPLGYANLRHEEASDLKPVHALCHRRIHERERAAACGCNAA